MPRIRTHARKELLLDMTHRYPLKLAFDLRKRLVRELWPAPSSRSWSLSLPRSSAPLICESTHPGLDRVMARVVDGIAEDHDHGGETEEAEAPRQQDEPHGWSGEQEHTDPLRSCTHSTPLGAYRTPPIRGASRLFLPLVRQYK